MTVIKIICDNLAVVSGIAALFIWTLVANPWIVHAIIWVVVGFGGCVTILAFALLLVVFLQNRREPADDLTNPKNWGI